MIKNEKLLHLTANIASFEPGRDTAIEYENTLWVKLYHVSHLVRRSRELELEDTGVSWAQATVLYILKNYSNPPTTADIARILVRRPHTVSTLLNRMTKQGLIKRKIDKKRKNQIRILITEKGEEAYIRSYKSNIIRDLISSLSKKEQDNLENYLDKLYKKAIYFINKESIPVFYNRNAYP